MGWNTPPDPACTEPGDLTGDGFNDVIGVSSTGALTLAPGTGTGRLLARQSRSPGFGGFKPMVIEDWTGDGCADLVAYTPADGHIHALPVTGDLEIADFVDIADFTGWTVTGIAALGDFTGDDNNDLLVRANEVGGTKGQMWLLAGNGVGGVLPGPDGVVFLGNTLGGVNTSTFTEFFSAGDWQGEDGIGDLFVRAKVNNGTLKLFPGDGLGGFKASKTKGTGWNFYNELFGSFDLSGDGLADIVGRDGDGALHIERSTRSGGFISGTPVISKGWGTFKVID